MSPSILKLALFGAFSDAEHASSSVKSPRSFVVGDDGAIGLGIVAAMGAADCASGVADVVKRSEPIAIAGGVAATAKLGSDAVLTASMEVDIEELSESYTCVIAHLGGNKRVKRVYYGGEDGRILGREEVYFEPPLPEMEESPFEVAEFLKHCFLCKMELDGRDIFMYKGEKAFCSEDCRCQHIQLNREHGSGALKAGSSTLKAEYSASPCSSPLLSAAGIAAA